MENSQPDTKSTGPITGKGLDTVRRSIKPMEPVSSHPVFVVDDTFFRSRTPKSTHWSVAWSDLMMTMFILFLTLFVYQLAHREFLAEDSPEIVAGAAMPIIEETGTNPALPFKPIKPIVDEQETVLLKSTRTKPDNIASPLEDSEVDAAFEQPLTTPATDQISPQSGGQTAESGTGEQASPDSGHAAETTSDVQAAKARQASKEEQPPAPEANTAHTKEKDTNPQAILTRMYDLSRVTVAEEKLEKFASVELVPDKTMRIILTGDLLFPSGTAELTDKAKQSLSKLIPIISQTPYMINVIGHTDNIPMHSSKFASNWELSTARASRVARFLIEKAKIPASHFVVAGYAYFRPIKPNSTAAGRKANRRVEIIISKEPPPAQQPTSSITP